jgi:DNA (cytosine-5)-methyltransferase 1
MSPTITKRAGTGGNNLPLVTAYRTSGNCGPFEQGDKTGALNTATDPTQNIITLNNLSVRRLTPTECERLQGFPDGWTAGESDSARYRMLGNAVAVPVIRWIAKRIGESL